MLDQIEGSQAIARVVEACRPQVVCAYPITPQTHIVEALGARSKSGELPGCRFMNVESEFAAMSVAIGASAAGARAYTATASQGLLYMTEAVYNAAGLGLPIVMTVANRAVGAPINIWNDHSDSMALRDAGWIQLFATDNQEAVDMHPQAFRLAEQLSIPVMVCVDGFVLTHAVDRIDVPDQEQVDSFLPPFEPRQMLDPDEPLTIGAMVGPEAFTEVRYLAHAAMGRVRDTMPAVTEEFGRVTGRTRSPFLTAYRTEDAETLVVSSGSVGGTLCDVVDEMRSDGYRIGSVSVTMFRPFPVDALRRQLSGASRVVTVDRAVAAGGSGYLYADVRSAVGAESRATDVIAGLGGRPVTHRSLRDHLVAAARDEVGELTFMDLRIGAGEAVGGFGDGKSRR